MSQILIQRGFCSSVGRVPVRVLAICLGKAMSNSKSSTLEPANLNGEPLISIRCTELRERKTTCNIASHVHETLADVL